MLASSLTTARRICSDCRCPRATRLTYEASTPILLATFAYTPMCSLCLSSSAFAIGSSNLTSCVTCAKDITSMLRLSTSEFPSSQLTVTNITVEFNQSPMLAMVNMTRCSGRVCISTVLYVTTVGSQLDVCSVSMGAPFPSILRTRSVSDYEPPDYPLCR